MKIGITCSPTYGGSGAVATELGIALAALGHEVHFITYQQPFRLPSFLPRVYFHEVDVGRYPLFEYPPYDLALAARMHEVVQTHELELLHVHYAIPHATSAWIAREMLQEKGSDVRIITTLHGTDITLVGQDPSDPHFHRPGGVRPERVSADAQGAAGARQPRAHPCIELPQGEARSRYRSHLRQGS
jgi:N-acetyl-alpha-D-glucosaminyl L-malate synthase BshA